MFFSNYLDDTTDTRMLRSYTIESIEKTQALELGGFVRLRSRCFVVVLTMVYFFLFSIDDALLLLLPLLLLLILIRIHPL